MKRRVLGAAVAVLGASMAVAAPATAAPKTTEVLQQYVVSGKAADPEALARAGYDMREAHHGDKAGHLIIATPSQAAKLEAKDVDVRPLGGTQATKRVPAPTGPLQNPTHGYDVFRPWSLRPAPCPNECVTPRLPLKQWYATRATANRDVVKTVVYGKSRLGQDLVAYRVTAGASKSADASKPVVQYHATQHAREWIAVETNRRLFDYVTRNKHNKASGIPQLLEDVELWFTPVVNPDGYDYTFVSPATRMWRKTLRDNNGDGAITTGDGVDPNRNWPTKWRFDPEGASDNPASETYRGPSAASEPEVKAYRALMQRLKAKFMIDYHSYGELILYPEGWQVETRATDDPLMEALAGHDEDHPAIPDYDPDLSAELYTVNGDITDDALHVDGTQAYTVELTAGSGAPVGGTDGSHPNLTPGGFAFQDSEADIQAVFEDNLEFALDLARSAPDPDDPKSHIGNKAPDFVPTAFETSHGDPQLVEVNAKKALGAVTAHWEIVGGGASGSVETTEWKGGLRYGAPGEYYHRMRAVIATGATPGQQVRVWFSADGEESEPFTYTLASDSGKRVLLMVAEDYTGVWAYKARASAPYFASAYRTALDDAGVEHDVYDVDAMGRKAASALGVLWHYDAVIWETGADYYPREFAPGGAQTVGVSKLFRDEVIEARDYMNDGGGLMVAGWAALQAAWDQLLYNPRQGEPGAPWCKSNTTTGQADADDPVGQKDNCIAVSNDFMQYWLGTYLNAPASAAEEMKEDPALGSTAFKVNEADYVSNGPLHTFLSTTSLIPTYSEFAAGTDFGSDRAIAPNRKPAFDPPTGEYYMSSGSANYGYKRLTRTIDLSGKAAADLSFKFSYDTEADYDYVFVEARTAGGDDWTTLPDGNGHTSDDTGTGCAEANPYWLNTHPHLKRYITRTETSSGFRCDPRTPDIWNAATGNSGGFQDWKVDLSRFAGKQVEVSIVYQTDPGTLGLGAFVDDATVTADSATLSETSFENDSGGWSIPGAPADSPGNTNDWTRSKSLGYVDGPGIRTPHSIVWGFGLETVQGADKRAALIKNAVSYLSR